MPIIISAPSSIAQALPGTAGTPGYNFTTSASDGMYLSAAGTLGLATAGVVRATLAAAGLTLAVPFSAGDGTAALPAFTFTSELSMGLWRIGTKLLGIAVNGVEVGRFDNSGAGNEVQRITLTDAGTNTVATHTRLDHATSGTPAAGFGAKLVFALQSTTTPGQSAGEIQAQWADATHATRRGRLSLHAYDGVTSREVIRVEGGGSIGRLGFWGATAIDRPTVSGSRSDTEGALNSLLTAIANLGLIVNTTTQT